MFVADTASGMARFLLTLTWNPCARVNYLNGSPINWIIRYSQEGKAFQNSSKSSLLNSVSINRIINYR
jgi:hypothetical protein